MAMENSDRLIAKFQKAQGQRFCPECGAQMVEIDRRSEDGTLFVWYECPGDNCDGQWLEKIHPGPQNSSISSESQQ